MQPVVHIDFLVNQIVANLNSNINTLVGQVELGESVEKRRPFSDWLDGMHVFANTEYPLLLRTPNGTANAGSLTYYSFYNGEVDGELRLDIKHPLPMANGVSIPASRIHLKLSTKVPQGSHYIRPEFDRTDFLYRGRHHFIKQYAPADLTAVVPNSWFHGTQANN